MAATVYNSSKGPKLIADLPYPYLCNAIAKMDRDGFPPTRDAEYDAMIARRDELAGEIEARAMAAGSDLPADHLPGANFPPEPTPPATPVAQPAPAPAGDADPFGALKAHADDLYLESKNWADGQEVETAAQAAEVDRLIDDWKDLIALAEAARDREIDPLNDAVKAVRERWYPLIADTTKLKGQAIRAKAALLAVKTKWGAKQRADQAAAAERLRLDGLAKAQEAAALAKTVPDNLEAVEQVELLFREAKADLRQAKAVENTKATGFRTVWRVEVADPMTAVKTMWLRQPEAFNDLALRLAQADVRAGVRSLEGFAITQDKVAA